MKSLDLLKEEIKLKMSNDSAHDFDHIMRVYKNAKKICKTEKANQKLVLAAVLLHDIISYPKSDKRSKLSSIQSAEASKTILKKHGFTGDEIKIISDAIRDHSFSQNKVPQTLEGKILQDADRLDALGAVGIARVFAVGGAENRPFYNLDDPFCKKRSPDDQIWTLDHFYKKLLLLESKMNTKTGKTEAKKRTKILKDFLSDLKKEI
ncbi:MAG: HD domain-containing protein [Nitrosopumilaceae archaeon]|nr:HD domain-containing protein [Nitrosopumilaceae archaeon]NIP09338.1 HD domain-containing protein [Nitrosopumilaceae archaeon]NIS94492.1 HD domain-containing protein [Nitrosopumilaceae archaeon]